MMELFAKIVNGFYSLLLLQKSVITDVWNGSEYVSKKCLKWEVKTLNFIVVSKVRVAGANDSFKEKAIQN